MKKLIIPLFFLLGFYPMFSQNFDFVVLTNGDSLACHIDSISDNRLYLEMYIRGNKVHTYMQMENIKEYKTNVINHMYFKINSYNSHVHSKNIVSYDLVVLTNGDSLACQIDSITDTRIMLELRYKGNWIKTFINRSEVDHYKYDEIDTKKFYFESGNSTIHSKKYPTGNQHLHMYSFGPSALSLS